MTKRSACLIFNPVAGNSDPEDDLHQIQSLLQEEIELDIRYTQEEFSGEQIAQEAISEGAELVIASGGDGTLSGVASALLNTNIPLGIISRGTANAFAHALGLPDTIEEACLAILEGKTKIVDAAQCNGKAMILLAAIGFEAKAVQGANRETKKFWGSLAYVIAGFKELRDLCSFDVEIQIPERTINLTASAVTVANAAPPTSILAQGAGGVIYDDGLLDVTIVAPDNAPNALMVSYDLLRNALQDSPSKRDDIVCLRTPEVKIITDPHQQVALDGELSGKTPVEIKCMKNALKLIVPASDA